MIKVTWDDGTTPVQFQISDDMLASFEKYRQTFAAPTLLPNGQWVNQVKYPTVKDMIIGVFIEHLVNPAMALFPTTDVATAMEQAQAAQAALDAAKAAVAAGIFASAESAGTTGTTDTTGTTGA